MADQDQLPESPLQKRLLGRWKWPGWATLISGFVRAAKRLLIGYSTQLSRNTFWVWCRGLAIPVALYAMGLALMLGGSDYFWIGVWIATLGTLLLALDLIWILQRESIQTKLLGIIAVLSFAGLVFWLVFRPAPIDATLVSPPSDFLPGSAVYGITWEIGYSALDVTITNPTDREYRNFDAWIGSDLLIAQHGMRENINHCVITAELPGTNITAATMNMADSVGNKRTVPVFVGPGLFANTNRIRCDSILPNSTIELMFALAPDIFISHKANPKWARFFAHYESGNRMHEYAIGECFLKPCQNVPFVPEIHQKTLFTYPLQ